MRARELSIRFWEKVRVCAGDGCWEWTGTRKPDGMRYGIINRGGRGEGIVYAHRAAWELQVGSIPAKMCVCHRCDNPACVRLDHLFLGTQAENLADMRAKGRLVSRGMPRIRK